MKGVILRGIAPCYYRLHIRYTKSHDRLSGYPTGREGA